MVFGGVTSPKDQQQLRNWHTQSLKLVNNRIVPFPMQNSRLIAPSAKIA